MKVPKLRSIVVLASAALVSSLALAAPAPAAPGAGFHLAFLAGPTDAIVGQRITSVPFVPTANNSLVQVELLNNSNNRVTNVPVTVTLSLLLDGVPSTAPIAGNVATTQSGVAVFDALSVGAANVAEVSDYALVASSTSNPDVLPATSGAFDVWESGERCSGGACTLRHFPADDDPGTADDPIPDTYTDPNSTAGVITASTFPVSVSSIECAGYTALTDLVVWHESTDVGPLFVVTHTSRGEMKNTASNGQVSVMLCLALSEDWNALNGTEPTVVNGHTLFVGLAPKCPKKNPAASAPCITAQRGDGAGGNFTEAWLPGTDPGKRS